MKILNLQVFLLSSFIFSFSLSAQEEKEDQDSTIAKDSQCQFVFEKTTNDWSDNRIYANGFDNSAGTLSRTYPEKGYTVQYDSQGRMNVYFWDRQFGYRYEQKSTPTKTEVTLPSEHYELVKDELYKEMRYLVQKQEVEKYNRGYAWRGGPTRSTDNGSAYNPSLNHPGTTYSSPKGGNGSNSGTLTKKKYNTRNSGGSDPYSRSTPKRTGHTLSK